MTEELADLRYFLSTRRAQRGKAGAVDRNRTAELDGDGDEDDRAGHSDSDDGFGKTSWLGVTINVPVGERGRGTNADGRLGFKTEDIIKHAGITSRQWSNYMVRNIIYPP